MKQLRSLKKWVSDYNEAQQLTEDLEVLLEFYKAGEIEEAELASNHNKLLDLFEEIEFRNMLSEEGIPLAQSFKLRQVLEVPKVVIGLKC